jgi:hypothetical protein
VHGLLRPAGAEQFVRPVALEAAGLESEHTESQLLVEEAGDPGFRQEGGAVAMALLAELDDAGVADGAREGRESAQGGKIDPGSFLPPWQRVRVSLRAGESPSATGC